MTDDNVTRASKLDTTAISDALDRLGIAGQCLNIKPLDHRFRMTGRAFTILYGPAGTPAGTVGDYIDDVEPGSVVVLDNGGRENATVWGDILTSIAHRRGVAGTVIDGACRDTHLSLELSYPIFSRSYSMRTGKDRVQVEAMNGPVSIGDARVSARHPAHARRCRAGGGRGDRRRGTTDPARRQRGTDARPSEKEPRLLPASDAEAVSRRSVGQICHLMQAPRG
jgi:regulator of RNase E activity RraA